eukprot:3284674-Pleurochrysis_carterae.AAC.1
MVQADDYDLAQTYVECYGEAIATGKLTLEQAADNEIVLNSAKVGLVLKDFDMYQHTNSCEYEPWQNPTERHMRMLQEPLRVMHERGDAGEEYWEYYMTQASLISN